MMSTYCDMLVEPDHTHPTIHSLIYSTKPFVRSFVCLLSQPHSPSSCFSVALRLASTLALDRTRPVACWTEAEKWSEPWLSTLGNGGGEMSDGLLLVVVGVFLEGRCAGFCWNAIGLMMGYWQRDTKSNVAVSIVGVGFWREKGRIMCPVWEILSISEHLLKTGTFALFFFELSMLLRYELRG